MNEEELIKKIGKKNLDKFFIFMRGQTVGIINGQYDYYECDVDTFLRRLEMTRKLKYKDIPIIKKELIKKQLGLCPICLTQLDTLKNREICLDHNHKTGKIRAVLCRACNSMEGKVFRLYQRMGLQKRKVDYFDLLTGLAYYYAEYDVLMIKDTGLIHPKFKEKSKRGK
jgi:hypothetical protein